MNAAHHEERLRVVLPPTDGPRVLGLSVRERAARVAKASGHPTIELTEVPALPSDAQIVIVPTGVCVTPAAIDGLESVRPSRRLVRGAEDLAIIAGTAGALSADVGSLPTTALPAGAAFDVRTPKRRATAERALLRATTKATDGPVARRINRPLSRTVSRLLLRAGLTANHATFIGLTIGLAAAWLCAQTGAITFIAAGLLYQLASAFDGVDGEMARATLSASPAGARLDTRADYLTHLACLVGVLVGLAREGTGAAGLALAVVTAITVGVVMLVCLAYVRRRVPGGSLTIIDQIVARAAADHGGATLAVARVLFMGLRRDVGALAICALSFTGARAVVPIVAALGAVLVGVTWLLRHDALRDAAEALKVSHADAGRTPSRDRSSVSGVAQCRSQ